MTSALNMVVVLALASLAPAIVLTATCFTRFVIVFSFLRTGLGTQSAPPSQVLVGLALFMTCFVMGPVAARVHESALSPYLAGQINAQVAIQNATPIVQKFLLRQTRTEDLEVFYSVAKLARPATPEGIPLRIALPAFALSELRTAFQMGLIVLLPFLVVDLVVSMVLTSLGMVMIPPHLLALPLKLLLFLFVDGWHLVVVSLLQGVNA